MLLKKIRSTEPLCHLGGEQTLIWHEPGRDLDADRHAFEYLIETDYSTTPLQPLPFSLDIMDSKKARTRTPAFRFKQLLLKTSNTSSIPQAGRPRGQSVISQNTPIAFPPVFITCKTRLRLLDTQLHIIPSS
jgi:hypothetical protein